MDKQWLSAKELIGRAGLPGSIAGIHKKAKREKWPYREVNCKGGLKGKRREYHVSALSPVIQFKIYREVKPKCS